MKKMIMFLMLAVLVAAATAAIQSVGGSMVQVAPLANVCAGVDQDNSIRVFGEQQRVKLLSDLSVNILSPGTYTGPSPSLTSGVIPSDTWVNSYLIHFLPEENSEALNFTGSVTFDEPVLGLIVLNTQLNASDYLGAPGTTYCADAGRRMELDGTAAIPNTLPDQVILSADRKTVYVRVATWNDWQDQVRVITEHPWVCETAWAEGDRYTERGNWATYTSYAGEAKEVTLYAGQDMPAGTVAFSAPSGGEVTITIALDTDWRFKDVPENVKIQDYESAPSGNPKPGKFDWKFDMPGATITVPENDFYGIHVEVEHP